MGALYTPAGALTCAGLGARYDWRRYELSNFGNGYREAICQLRRHGSAICYTTAHQLPTLTPPMPREPLIASSVSSLWGYVLASAEVANVTDASQHRRGAGSKVASSSRRRRYLERPKSISAIVGIDDRGRLVLRRANDCEFVGDGSRARLTFNQPDRTVTRTIENRGLVDIKWAEHHTSARGWACRRWRRVDTQRRASRT